MIYLVKDGTGDCVKNAIEQAIPEGLPDYVSKKRLISTHLSLSQDGLNHPDHGAVVHLTKRNSSHSNKDNTSSPYRSSLT
jgi:hypothetical protein